jgi:hypothetical protein
MGAFFDTINIRCGQNETLGDVLRSIANERFSYILTTPSRGWSTLLLDDDGLSLDDDEHHNVCLELSRCYNSLILKTAEHDSDVFYYTCFFAGKLIDSFVSIPDYFEPVTEAERVTLRGKPERWIHLLDFSVDVQELRRILDLMQSTLLCEHDGVDRFTNILHLDNIQTNYYEQIEDIEPQWIVYDHNSDQ